MSTTSQQTPPAPALTDTELTHLATALTGYATSAHPAYRAAAARTALDALASIKAHIWESAAAPQQTTTATLRAALDTLTNTPLESITAAIQLTDSDRAALASLAATRLDTCPVCADLVPEDSPAPFCSISCQQYNDTSA